eukprot:bmy_05506T0
MALELCAAEHHSIPVSLAVTHNIGLLSLMMFQCPLRASKCNESKRKSGFI